MLRLNNQTEQDGRVAILKLSGRLDASTVKQLQEVLDSAAVAKAQTLVVVMDELSYVSSSGLRALLLARTAAGRRNGDVILAALSQPVREVFDMVGFSAVFSIFDTVDQARVYAQGASNSPII